MPKLPKLDEESDLAERIRQVLMEARVVLPGVQALLGFQFATTFMSGFVSLPTSARVVHLVSLGMTALSTLLLIAPSAYHRIVERGAESERFHRFASRMVLSALVPLALGLAGDVYVVVIKTVADARAATLAALGLALAAAALWFAWPLLRAARRSAPRGTPLTGQTIRGTP